MSFLNTISVDDKEQSVDKKFTIIKGIENKNLKGFIYDSETSELLSASFGNACTVDFDEKNFQKILSENSENQIITVCYEGPLVKIWFDKEGKYHFSTSSKVDGSKSFWGNKNETFEKIFQLNGGDTFIRNLSGQYNQNLTHHFMIMTNDFTVTTRIDFRNNDAILVYLGTVSLDGQIMNPNNLDPNVYYYHNVSGFNFLPSKEELAGRILIPSRLTPETCMYILQNGYNKQKLSGHIHHDITSGESIIIRSNNKIIKVLPKCYELRSVIAGRTPNVKNQLYRLMEIAKDFEKFKETFPVIGKLDESQIEILKTSDKSETTFIIDTFLGSNKNFNLKSIDDRMKNILSIILLTTPLTKIDKTIVAWRDYLECKNLIVKFVKSNNSKIRDGNYDEKLESFHGKALSRFKDLATVSKNYASDTNNGHSYASKLDFSIRGLVRNEFGCSLYRLEKAINFLKIQD